MHTHISNTLLCSGYVKSKRETLTPEGQIITTAGKVIIKPGDFGFDSLLVHVIMERLKSSSLLP